MPEMHEVWDPNDWELHVYGLLQDRHGPLNIHKVPARHRGDHGLDYYSLEDQECYAVQEPCDVADRAEKQKAKITVDLKKFCTKKTELCSLFGSVQMTRWVLLAPLHDSSQLNAHATAKTIEVIREQVAIYGFSTFPPPELEISHENYRPQREGFEIGFEMSASDTIRLKWAYQLALLEVARETRTHHAGLVIFDEPQQQKTARISFKKLLDRAATAAASGQQIIFETSEDRDQLEDFLSGLDCHFLPFDGPIVRRVT